MRLRKKKWIRDALDVFIGGLILTEKNFTDDTFPISKYFSKENILEMEIATGKGNFLVNKAANNPNINYIGVEKEIEILYYAAKKASDLNLQNIKFLAVDVNDIGSILQEKIISCLYINFCDPWPKKKHAKKRLTNVDFLQKYRLFLQDKANVILKTDNKDLFEYSCEQFKKVNMLVSNLTYDWHNEASYLSSGDITTEYEKKYSGFGKGICRVCAYWLEDDIK